MLYISMLMTCRSILSFISIRHFSDTWILTDDKKILPDIYEKLPWYLLSLMNTVFYIKSLITCSQCALFCIQKYTVSVYWFSNEIVSIQITHYKVHLPLPPIPFSSQLIQGNKNMIFIFCFICTQCYFHIHGLSNMSCFNVCGVLVLY